MLPLNFSQLHRLATTRNWAFATVNIRNIRLIWKPRGTINFINFPLEEIQQAAVRRSVKAGGRLSLAVHVALGYVASTRRH